MAQLALELTLPQSILPNIPVDDESEPVSEAPISPKPTVDDASDTAESATADLEEEARQDAVDGAPTVEADGVDDAEQVDEVEEHNTIVIDTVLEKEEDEDTRLANQHPARTLRDMCRDRGLGATGSKLVLARRLLEHGYQAPAISLVE